MVVVVAVVVVVDMDRAEPAQPVPQLNEISTQSNRFGVEWYKVGWYGVGWYGVGWYGVGWCPNFIRPSAPATLATLKTLAVSPGLA